MAIKDSKEPVNLRLGDSPYSFCPYTPGLVRLSACVEFGCFEEKFYDQGRMNYIKQNLAKDLGMCQDEIQESMRDFRLGLRPMSPDNLEIIGPMR